MSVTFLQPSEVAKLLKAPTRDSILVVDVRNEDFVAHGGHIAGCVNFSVEHFSDDADDWRSEVDEFLQQHIRPDLKTVIVHCFLCEQRGPFCAKRLASRLQNMEREEPRVCVLTNGFKRFSELYSDDHELIVGDDGSELSTETSLGAPEACCGDFAHKDLHACFGDSFSLPKPGR